MLLVGGVVGRRAAAPLEMDEADVYPKLNLN